jgi:signal transduction histidine kinase
MRTPITSILGYAEGILDNVASTPQQIHAYAQIIQSKALVLKTLADDMALLSLLESKPPLVLTQVDLAALCERFAKEVELDGSFSVKTDIQGPLHVMVEMDKMERVFQNLISNAAKYGKPVDSKPMLEFTARRNGDSALITLSDNGPGLSVEEQRRVFSRFYRVDSSRGEKNGSGLGLAICQQIIELLGGKIWMSQREQGGLSCHMLIPLREDKS